MDEEEEEEEKVEEEKIEDEEENNLTETKGRSRREAGLSLWNITACAGDDDLDGVALTQSKFRTTSLLNEKSTKEKDVESETKDDDDDVVVEEEKEEESDDEKDGEKEKDAESENVNESIIALDDDDDSVGEEEKVEDEDLNNDKKVEIETKEDDVEIETKEDDNDSVIALDDDDDDLDIVEEEKKKKKQDDSIIDLTQQQQPVDDNDDSHIFDTQRDDMREMLLGIADVDSDLPSTQKTNKTSSFSLEESTIMYDHIEDEAPIGVVTGGSVQNDDVIVLSDDDDDDDSKKKTQTKSSSKPTKSKIAASRQKSKVTSTNCPDYAGMKVNELHKLVQAYGMRKLSKRKMVDKLTEIWHYLNDKTVNVLQPVVPRTSSQPAISNSSRTKTPKRSVSVGSEENADPRTTQLLTYIRSHRNYEKILMMQTIDLAAFRIIFNVMNSK